MDCLMESLKHEAGFLGHGLNFQIDLGNERVFIKDICEKYGINLTELIFTFVAKLE